MMLRRSSMCFHQFNKLIGTTAPVAAETTFYGFHLGAGQSGGRIELKFVGMFNDSFWHWTT